MKIIEQLGNFITGDVRSMWISDDIIKIYVKKGIRLLSQGTTGTTLDIGNIVVNYENINELFSFLNNAHQLNPWDATYVECGNIEEVAIFLMRSGWMQSANNSFFMPKDLNKYYDKINLEERTKKFLNIR